MKLYDKVKIITDRLEYAANNVHKGDVGTIWFPEIKQCSFAVYFDIPNTSVDFTLISVSIKDLEVIKESDIINKEILDELPTPDPHWWCKVENGFILNLLGEKKNKIPYDYDS